MMILLCELAKEFVFDYFGQKNNYQAVIIFNNLFPYRKLNILCSDTFKWTCV